MVYKEMLLDALVMLERSQSIDSIKGMGPAWFIKDVKNILVQTGQKDVNF